MSWATAVFLIVAMSLSIPLLKIWTSHARKRQAKGGADETRVASVEGELDELRERVETLERIVTDERHSLEREFEQLDGTRRPPAN